MLSTDKLSIAFGGVHACRDVSVDFETGSTTAIVGPNGAGKSTFVQLLAGVLRPDSGDIRLGDRRITRVSVARRCALGIGRTFQTPRIFPGITIWESTMLGAYAGAARAGALRVGGAAGDEHHETPNVRNAQRRKHFRAAAEERAAKMLALFGDRLLPRRGDLTYSLSYANRRRVEIARVLAAGPRVLLLDEPTAGMNPTETLELAGVLAGVKARDPELTVIVIEHKMEVVHSLAERVVVMDAGRVIADGDPATVLAERHVVEAYLGTRGSVVREVA